MAAGNVGSVMDSDRSSTSSSCSCSEFALQKDSDIDIEFVGDDYVEVFGASDGEEDGFFESSDEDNAPPTLDDFSSDSDDVPLQQLLPPAPKKKASDCPDGWSMTKWKHGDHPLQPPPQFSAKPGLNFDAPDDADELFFLNSFSLKNYFNI